MKWLFKYSFVNDAIIVNDNNDIIVGCICIDNRSLVLEESENGLPKGIKNIYMFIPKRKLIYKDETVYNEKDKELFKRFPIKQSKFSNLIENYIRNLL